MSTVAMSETAGPTLLVVRPVPQPGTDGNDAGNVIKMPRRLEPSQQPVPQRPAGTASIGNLKPEAAERAIVGSMSCKIAPAVLEVLSGVRSVQQLSRWLDTMCMSALTTRARLHAEACKAAGRRRSHDVGGNVQPLYHQPLVHSVHCSPVSPGIFETSVVIADKTRFRAMAMRFELQQGLWKVTALKIG